MTDIQIEREKNSRFQAFFAAAVLISLIVAVFFGLKLETAQNSIILPRSPFDELSFFEGAVRVCIWDVIAFWILTVSLSGALRIFISSALYFSRGLIIGNALRVFFENSVPAVAITVLLSYFVITLLLLVYDAFLNASGKRGALCRVASCLIATGAAAIIRIVPMLLL